MTGNVYFDSELRCRSGKFIPYYDVSLSVENLYDKKLVWFHEGYGDFKLYRLHQIDNTKDFIAEDLHRYCSTGSEKWDLYIENPELALAK